MPRSRIKQSRLTFTPLPSSSPAAKGYHQQIQARAAAVSYEGSPSPAKRFEMENTTLSPPTTTMDATGPSAESDSEPIPSTQRRPNAQDRLASHRQPKQQPIDFAAARQADSFDAPVKLSSSARNGMFSSPRAKQATVDSSSDDDENDDETNNTLSSPVQRMTPPTEKRPSRGGRKSEGRKSRGTRETRSSRKTTAVTSEDEGDNIVVGGSLAPGEDLESESSEDMPTTLGRQPRKRQRQSSGISFISSSPPRAIESDDDLVVIERPKKRSRLDSDNEEEEEKDDEDDEPKSSNRRRLKRPRKHTRQEQDDLNEDLDFLGPSSDVESSARPLRDTQSAKKSARMNALEILKRKRSGQAAQPQSQVEDENSDGDGEEDGNDNNGNSDLAELYDESNGQAPITSSREMFNATEEDDDFIDQADEGEEGILGVPDGIPIEFTRFGSMKAKELFKYAVEWMVQKKINPAFQMNDEIYELTFKKLDDEVKGLAGSKFTSAAWTPEFTIALKSRPDIEFEDLDRNSSDHWMRDKCDACNRSNHIPTFVCQFKGSPYNRESLEEITTVDDDDDDDEDDDDRDEQGVNNDDDETDNKPAYDAEGREVPAAAKVYHVGRFCMSNARTAHALHHWRFHLNEWVVTWLIRQGYNTASKIVERDRWNTKKRRKYANKIVDRMERESVVKQLWRDFRRNIDEARNSKQGRYQYGSP